MKYLKLYESLFPDYSIDKKQIEEFFSSSVSGYKYIDLYLILYDGTTHSLVFGANGLRFNRVFKSGYEIPIERRNNKSQLRIGESIFVATDADKLEWINTAETEYSEFTSLLKEIDGVKDVYIVKY